MLEIMTPAERNQVMGHSRSSIFEHFYRNHVVSTDIAAAVLKTPSRSSLLASIGHIGIDRDPRAPKGLNPKEQASILADKRYVEIQEHIKELRTRQYKNDQQPSGRRTITERKALASARASAQSLRRKLLREAKIEKRRRFFEHIDNDDIRRIKHGVPITFDSSVPVRALQARRNVVSIFSGVSQTERRMEVLENLIELCHVREPHHMNPASRASQAATEEVQNQNGVQELQDAFESMELIPLVLPSFICLFCLGDTRLTFAAKTTSFSRIDSLRRHMDDIHLCHYEQGVPITCPHPSCDTSLKDVDLFKNHAATVHNVFMSKK